MNARPTQMILADRKITYYITDRELRVLQVSDAADLPPRTEAAVGRPLLELVPELRGNEMALAEILAGRLPRFELAEVNRAARDQQTICLTLVCLPYGDANGQISGLIHFAQDVTDRVTIEQHVTQQCDELQRLHTELERRNQLLMAANTELRSLDEMKAQFVLLAAHELRSPLTAITGYLELLLDEDGCFTEQQRDYLGIIQSSARRLLKLTNDLLDLTRIEAGRLELVMLPTDLGALLRATANEYATQIAAKAQQLTLEIPDGLPGVLCDGGRAFQIIGNLIGNAVKYTPVGGAITIRLARAAAEGFLQISVHDTGIGIPITEQARVFERFFRASSASAAGVLGIGLGLHITRALIELHGGKIWLESEAARGTTFFVTFPITDTPVVEDWSLQIGRVARSH